MGGWRMVVPDGGVHVFVHAARVDSDFAARRWAR
jgi:hypothetical protein